MRAPVKRSAPSRARRLAAVGLGVAALAVGGLAAFHVPSSGADTNRPATFSGAASAAAVHEEENGQAGFAVYEPFYGTFAEGTTNYSNDGQLARASTFWPGPTFGNAGGLVCQLACQPIPPYPLSVQTEGPPSQPPSVSQQTGTQVGGSGQPSSLSAASADANADPATGVSTDAVDGDFAAPGESPAPKPASSSTASAAALPSPSASTTSSGGRLATASAAFFRQASVLLGHPVTASAAASSAVVAVKSMTSATAQRFSGSTLLSDAQTEVSGVSLLGGMIDIASIHTESHSKTDGAGVHTHNDVVTVSGVTVAGQPATIGSGGVTVTGQGTGSAVLQSLNAALQQALAAAGADVTLIGTTTKPPQPLGGCTDQQADGVFVHTTANAQAAPLVGDIYNGDYTLGSSCTSVSAAAPALSLPSTPAVPLAGSTGPTGATGATDNGSGAALPADTGSGSSTDLGGGGASTGNQAATPSGGSGTPRNVATTTGLLGPFVSHRFSTLYLSVVLALLAVLVGLGFHVPRPTARGVGRRSGQ